MENGTLDPTTEEWAIGVTVGSAIAFVGTREEAQEHMNRFVAHLEQMFRDNKLSFVRKEHTIVRRGNPALNGGMGGQ
jgi:hypothetical protein